MIILISIGGLGNAVANLMGESSNDALCKLIACLNTFFDWAMLLSVVAVAIQLYLVIFLRTQTGKYEWAYHYVIWSVAVIVSLLPFFSNKYGNSGVWCWIVHDVGWRMGIWYGPLFFVIVVLFGLYISIIVKIRSLIRTWERTYTPDVEAKKKFLKQEARPLIFYPFVYLIVYLIPTVNRIHNALNPSDPIYELVLIAGICAAAIGLANSLIYGLDKETRSKLTKTHIKNAWYSHIAPEVKMGEYSTEAPPTEKTPPTPSKYHQSGVRNPVFTVETDAARNSSESSTDDGFVTLNI
ncbi:uncharacterized protein LOC135479655 [Liolophura sinensis]|uniref:uncharacterized protein LOC135479655 n=1 Tax=Liolophura sinensis TaxID=3198878 RepID=UPI003158C065